MSMAHRTFTDAAGVEWTVYDVIPRVDERRADDRRRDSEPDIGTEDRRLDDRRVAVAGHLPSRLTDGWLCFESAGDRRRLQPIPAEWSSMPDAQLTDLLGQARPAGRRQTSSSS
jgi:hypothetical protein